ncbi:MAG: TetR/AcrR family transcriptional regulator [Bacteroidetes bacterium]|nr:TetR/AcrR family transcriptional regulator [Bacteroidota bacterium]
MNKREQIIKAAMNLLIEHGVQGTPMSLVAKEANTGMGTIYNYFPAKEDLINAIYIYIKQDELKSVTGPLADESIQKQFEHFYRTMIRYMLAHPTHFWFMEQFSASPIIKEETRTEGMNVFTEYMATLKHGQKQGLIKSINLDELIQFVHGGIKGFIRAVLLSGKSVTPKMIDNQLRISWDAIKE